MSQAPWESVRKPAQSPAGLRVLLDAQCGLQSEFVQTRSHVPSGGSNLQVVQCSFKLIKLINGSFGFYIIVYKLEMKTYSLKLRANYLLVPVHDKSQKFSYVKLKILIFAFFPVGLQSQS